MRVLAGECMGDERPGGGKTIKTTGGGG